MTQKLINQFLNQVPNLAKCMYVMCENNERYDCKTAIWIKKKWSKL